MASLPLNLGLGDGLGELKLQIPREVVLHPRCCAPLRRLTSQLERDADVREIFLRLENTQSDYSATVNEAYDMFYVGKNINGDMLDLVNDLLESAHDTPTSAARIPANVSRDLSKLRDRVPDLRQRSQQCIAHFEEVATSISKNLERIRTIGAKFAKEHKNAVFWIDLALGFCRVVVEACTTVAAFGIPVVSPAMQGGRVLGTVVQGRLSSAKGLLQDKDDAIKQVDAAIQERLKCAREVHTWWADVEKHINGLWEEVDSATQAGFPSG